MTQSRHSECRVASIRPTTVMPRSALHGEGRKDASSNVTTVGTRSSSLRQPRLAQAVKNVLGILGVLVNCKTLPAFNRETGVDPQHLCGLCPGLLRLSQLGIGGREPKTGMLQIGHAQCAFPAQTRRLSIALEQVIGDTRDTECVGPRKRIETHVSLQYLDRPCGLA